MISFKLKEIECAAASPKCEISYLKSKIHFIFKKYRHSAIEILPHETLGKFHRSRKMNTKPMLIENLSYPPIECAQLQRANHNKNPVFYCSGDPRATFFELGLKQGDTIVLSKWVLVKKILVFPLGYSPECFVKLGANRACPIEFPEKNKQHNQHTPSNTRITEFLFEKFTAPASSKPYKLSASIAESFLKIQEECGVAYPSIDMQANAENFALTPSLVNNSLKVISAKWFNVLDIRDFEYRVEPIDYSDSFSDNGKIIWKGYVPDEEKKCL